MLLTACFSRITKTSKFGGGRRGKAKKGNPPPSLIVPVDVHAVKITEYTGIGVGPCYCCYCCGGGVPICQVQYTIAELTLYKYAGYMQCLVQTPITIIRAENIRAHVGVWLQGIQPCMYVYIELVN